MIHLSSYNGRTVVSNEKEYLFFSGYAYLCMHTNESFVQLLHDGLKLYGWLFPSSRISNTQLPLFDAMEQKLTALTQTKETVLVNSGFTAANMAARYFATKGQLFIAPGTHPALLNNKRSFDGNFENWIEMLERNISSSSFMQIPVLLSDAVNPLTAEIRDFSFLKHINRKTICIIDDSHGIGLIGTSGEGISAYLPENEYVDYIITYSLSKAFQIKGGAISCSNVKHAAEMRKMPEYTASTSISPAEAFAFVHGEKYYREQREKLRAIVDYFIGSIQKQNRLTFKTHPQLPVFVFEKQIDADQLQNKGILISSFAYPNPNDKLTQRIVLNAAHTAADIESLFAALA